MSINLLDVQRAEPQPPAPDADLFTCLRAATKIVDAAERFLAPLRPTIWFAIGMIQDPDATEAEKEEAVERVTCDLEPRWHVMDLRVWDELARRVSARGTRWKTVKRDALRSAVWLAFWDELNTPQTLRFHPEGWLVDEAGHKLAVAPGELPCVFADRWASSRARKLAEAQALDMTRDTYEQSRGRSAWSARSDVSPSSVPLASGDDVDRDADPAYLLLEREMAEDTAAQCAAVRRYATPAQRRLLTAWLAQLAEGGSLADAARDAGLPIVRSERQTVGAYLATWLAAVEGRVKSRTHAHYGELIRLYVLPTLGKVALAKLTAAQLEALYTALLKRGLSPTTVHHIHAVVRTALGRAERQEIIPRNVAALAAAPRMRRIEMPVLTADEARRLLDVARGERLEALYVLALSTGMRQGELLGLRWREVDLDRATARVTATLQNTGTRRELAAPKTHRSKRQIALTLSAVSVLRAHRARQAEERLRAGAAWTDWDLVFCNQLGGPLQKGNVLVKDFVPLLKRAGVRRVRFHDLRHTAATLLLGHGVPVKVVSELLGHASIAITLDIYAHVLPDMQAQAAEVMEAALGAR